MTYIVNMGPVIILTKYQNTDNWSSWHNNYLFNKYNLNTVVWNIEYVSNFEYANNVSSA